MSTFTDHKAQRSIARQVYDAEHRTGTKSIPDTDADVRATREFLESRDAKISPRRFSAEPEPLTGFGVEL